MFKTNPAKQEKVIQKGYYLIPKINLLSKHQRWLKQAKKLNLSQEAQNRLKWMIYYETKGKENTSKTARYFGIGRSTFYKWFNRFDGINLRTLETQSRAPQTTRGREFSLIKDSRVIKLRKKYPQYGHRKLKIIYERIYSKDKITEWYIQRVIEEYSLYFHKKKRYSKAKRRQSLKKKRITELFKTKAALKGFFIHLDTIEIRHNGLKRYILTGIEDKTKFAYARMYKQATSSSAKDFLERMKYTLENDEVRIKTIHTDNGSEFHKNFIKLVEKLNIIHYWSRSRTPKDNPSSERFNRTLQEKFIAFGNYTNDAGRFNKMLTEWLIEYNAIRPHETLGDKTPLEALEKMLGLSTMWSSCTTTRRKEKKSYNKKCLTFF